MRHIFSCSAAAAFFGLASARAAASAPNPDAPLIALCDEYHRLDMLTRVGPDDATCDRWLARRNRVADLIEEATATTESGKLAKCGVALALLHEAVPHPTSDFEGMAISAFSDVLGRAGA